RPPFGRRSKQTRPGRVTCSPRPSCGTSTRAVATGRPPPTGPTASPRSSSKNAAWPACRSWPTSKSAGEAERASELASGRPRASAENRCRDTGPRRRLLEEVRPTATCCENRLVGRTSRASAENLCRVTGPRRRLLEEVRPTATCCENRLVGRTSRASAENLCRDTGPRRRLLEEVRPTATCCENRLVGRTSLGGQPKSLRAVTAPLDQSVDRSSAACDLCRRAACRPNL